MIHFTEEQAKKLVDADNYYQQYLSVTRELARYEGWMRWKETNGREYLISGKSQGQGQKSHGRRTPETELMYQQFKEGKAAAKAAMNNILKKLGELAPVYKGLRMGKIPHAFARIIRQYDVDATLKNYLMVAGTHAIYCYESLAGYWLDPELGATEDLDLVWNGAEKGEMVTVKPPASLLKTLKDIDSTYTVNQENRFQARNSKGQVIDFITSHEQEKSAPKEYLSPIGIDGQAWLMLLPPVQAIVIDTNGLPLRLFCPDPRLFALHKLWVSERPDRTPLKVRKDKRQGKVILQLVQQHLPHLPFDDAFKAILPEELMPYLPAGTDENEDGNIDLPVM